MNLPMRFHPSINFSCVCELIISRTQCPTMVQTVDSVENYFLPDPLCTGALLSQISYIGLIITTTFSSAVDCFWRSLINQEADAVIAFREPLVLRVKLFSKPAKVVAILSTGKYGYCVVLPFVFLRAFRSATARGTMNIRRRLSGSPWQNDDGQPFLPLRPSEKYPLGILPVWGFLLFNCVIQLNQICHSLDTTTAHLHLSHGHQITRLAVSHALVENCTW